MYIRHIRGHLDVFAKALILFLELPNHAKSNEVGQVTLRKQMFRSTHTFVVRHNFVRLLSFSL